MTVYADSTLREVANAFARHARDRRDGHRPEGPRADPGAVTLGQLLHARREDLREEEHRQRPLPVVLIPAALTPAPAGPRGSGGRAHLKPG